MKIIHVAWGYYPEHKGCGPVIYLHGLAVAQRNAGHDVAVVCASDRTIPGEKLYATCSECVDGIDYIHLCNRPVYLDDFWHPLREARDDCAARAFNEVFTARAPEIVHIHNFAGLSFDVVPVALSCGARIFSSLHNYFPLCSRNDLFFADTERCEGPLARSCSRCLGTMLGDDLYRARLAAGVQALNACDFNFAVSERVAEIYRAHGVEPRKIAVERIGTGTGEHLWNTIGAERVARAAAGAEDTSERPLDLVFFGNVSLARKGAMTFLSALLRLNRPDLVRARVFGGIGAQREHIDALLNACSATTRTAISFHETFAQEDLADILADADAAVLTPRWDDNGPQTVFEALSAGLPVLATQVGGIPDVVEHEQNGILVAEGDSGALAVAIDMLAADRQRLVRMRAAIRPPRTMNEHATELGNFYARRVEAAGMPLPLHSS